MVIWTILLLILISVSKGILVHVVGNETEIKSEVAQAL